MLRICYLIFLDASVLVMLKIWYWGEERTLRNLSAFTLNSFCIDTIAKKFCGTMDFF